MPTDTIKNTTVVGAGFMGCQIATQAAVFGDVVTIFDVAQDVLAQARDLTKFYMNGYSQANGGDPNGALERIDFTDDIASAVKDADLVIEAVTEDLGVKKKVFALIDEHAPKHAVIGTNSSSLPVSKIEDAVSRKGKVVNIHFASPIPQRNYIEIMRGTKTTDDTVHAVEAWSRSINCLPLTALKESMGFVINRVWHAARKDALAAWAGGYVDYKDIDRGWMKLTGMPAGPFGAMDYIGIDVVLGIERAYYEELGLAEDEQIRRLAGMVERGELGMKSGRGFYSWPEPEFSKPEFLDPKVK